MTDLLTLVTTDFAGITRGRSIPAQEVNPGEPKSVGWVRGNRSLTACDEMAEPNGGG